MQETPVWFLGQEDPLEKGKTTHSSILVWRIPRTWGHKELDTIEWLSPHSISVSSQVNWDLKVHLKGLLRLNKNNKNIPRPKNPYN